MEETRDTSNKGDRGQYCIIVVQSSTETVSLYTMDL